jgi:uncharacterized protein (TIGR02145 family)
MKLLTTRLIFVLAVVLLTSCKQKELIEEVKIGNQIWTSKNLNVDKFNNGDIIPEAKTAVEWKTAYKNRKPAWCYYDNDTTNGLEYGKLYNWYAVKDPRGVAPKGWHIPSKEEWLEISNYLGGEKIAGDKMKSTTGWDVSGSGSNESKFTGLPGGFRFETGDFSNITSLGNFWSTTETSKTEAEVFNLDCGTSDTFFFFPEKGFGVSVRCVKD